jgi:hypothetical protein
VTLPSRRWLSAALGVCLAPAFLSAQTPNEPPRLGVLPTETSSDVAGIPASVNQRMADLIAAQLRQSGQLRHYTVDIAFQNGSAELTGTVTDQPQREEVLRIVQGVPGVERVVDRLQIAPAITRVQGEIPRLPDPTPKRGPDNINARPNEPVPVFQAPPPSPPDLNPPKLPPYAWPTYAPYNNYSRVAYPEAYPYNAWPFIGPPYPFPKVPLGWRAVKLEWDDGYWWFSKVATKYDWWRLRYW